ncbi:methyltransferase type 11 [Mycobacterium sp. 1465703.0]|nr:methyltransferase domain-containing protein [Mycobacterium sp. 1465703.0]OBI95521.1 methyltransferase type 11 [Mycobacterium sp. 1465703.0]
MNEEHRAIYTHGHHESVLRSHQRRTAEDSAAYLLPYLKPGMSVLDVGCGPGTITADLAARVAPGPVTAVDQAADVLDVARTEVEQRDLSNVSFATADVHHLEFADDTFDVVHAHQVLQHVADPVAALREMRRVCAPDGIVAARDADYAGFIWHPQPPALDLWRDLYQRVTRANRGEPDAGRRLLSWAQQAGFGDITPTGSLWCYATAATRDWWGGMWADRILHSTVTRDLVSLELATTAQLEEISAGWREWAAAPDGWIAVPHGEIICRA